MLKLSKDLSLPVDLAAQAICIFGIRGSGKTNTAGAFAEELLDFGQPIVIIDPTDAWWGLRSDYPIMIFGGNHGDMPLQETDGKTIAEFQVQEQVPFILSIRHLRKGAQRRFVTDFCEELYHLKGKDQYRSPLTVFIDEAPLFVPQKVMGEVARTVGAVEDLIARGRNAGFGVMLISQRCATLNADVRTQADTIISHRLTAKLDRDALKGWFEENASTERLSEILSSLATLKNGEAWVWAPSLDVMQRVQMRKRRTFDSSASPKPGQKAHTPKSLKSVDLEKLKGKLAASIEKARADDPVRLKARIAELEAEARKQTAVAADPDEVKRAVNVALVARDQQWRSALVEMQQLVEDRSMRLRQIAEQCRLNGDSPVSIPPPPPVAPLSTVQQVQPMPRPKRERKPHAGVGRPAGVTKPQQRVLDAITWWSTLGIDNPTSEQVAFVARLNPKGGHFSTTVGPLSTGGLIERSDGRMRLTENGVDASRLPDRKPTLSEYHESIRQILKTGPQVRILNAIIAMNGRECSTEHIGSQTDIDPAGGHFSTSIGPLSTLGLIERRSGIVRPTQLLFPPGLS